jgi:precorrin-6B methylase 2
VFYFKDYFEKYFNALILVLFHTTYSLNTSPQSPLLPTVVHLQQLQFTTLLHSITMLDLGPVDLLVPVVMILVAALYIPLTAGHLLLRADFACFIDIHCFQQIWFQRFWSFFGWLSKPLFAPDIEATLTSAHGIVLDVGSGAGDWLYALSPRRNPNISKVILLEPNSHFHARLRANAEENGLDGKYEIIGCRAEDLEREGIQLQTIDTIVTIHVLCSIPSSEKVVSELYKFLRPGGRWLVYEHVRSNRAPAAAWQSKWSLP